MVHADLIYGLSFVESCIIKSAFQNSVLDSVFIHAQVGVLNSSYLDELMSDPVLEEKIMIMETDFGVENSDKLSPKQIVSAGLRYTDISSNNILLNFIRGVVSFGGFYLKV